jgi:hypothetical protein
VRNEHSEHTKHGQRLVNLMKFAIVLLPNANELVDEVDACSETPQHETPHQPCILIPGCEVALYEQKERQRQSKDGEVVLDVHVGEDEVNELDGETNPKEEIELDEAEEDLVMSKHALDSDVGAKKLVNLPTKLAPHLPRQSHISDFGEREDNVGDVDECHNRD